jgi:hypothetical protein
LGDLIKDFDFKQKPRAPLLLPPQAKTDLVAPPATPTPSAPHS